MFTPILLIFILFGILFIVVLELMRTFGKGRDSTTVEWLKSTQHEIRSLQQSLADSSSKSSRELSESMRMQTQEIHERLSRAAEVIGELKREAGAFSEVSRSMKDLHEFLKSPKLRGSIGEQVLNDLVAQMFPKQKFYIQYHFKTGSIVDLAIQTDAGILPIDSKFPLEHFTKMFKEESAQDRAEARREFSKDVKKHVDDISTKYILPQEGTMDFALMYVPSESVFYEIANDPAILEYARLRRVYPVSPTTLYAHLQTILLSFEGKKMEVKSKEVFALLRGIQRDYVKVENQVNLLGKHLMQASNTFSSVSTSFSQLGRNMNAASTLNPSTSKTEKLL